MNDNLISDVLSSELGEHFGTFHAITEVILRKNIYSGFLTWNSILDNITKFKLGVINCVDIDFERNILTVNGLYGAKYTTRDFVSFFVSFSHHYENTFLVRKPIYRYFYHKVLVELTKKTYVLKKIVKYLGYPKFEINLLYMIYDMGSVNLSDEVSTGY